MDGAFQNLDVSFDSNDSIEIISFKQNENNFDLSLAKKGIFVNQKKKIFSNVIHIKFISIFLDFTLVRDQTSRIVNHSLKFKSSYKSMEEMEKIVNSTPNSSIKVPHTIYRIKKSLPPTLKHEIHIQCLQCLNYTPSPNSETKCTLCDVVIQTTKSNYFTYIPIKQQLELSLKQNYDSIISYASTVSQMDNITDLHNGKMLMNAQMNYPNSILLPLIINTDGVKIYKSAQKSLWLIQVCQAYLPPTIRYMPQNILIVAAHFGSKKPKMIEFFYPLLNELRKIKEEGGIMMTRNEITFCQ